MSLVLQSSGGGSVTIQEPVTASNFTQTVPAATGTIAVADGSGNLSVTGNLSFNSGYGSSAVAYGCRAWVNFNGTGTVAIRASGNVSSITDNGTGNYSVNLTNALTDSNYSAVVTATRDGTATGPLISVIDTTSSLLKTIIRNQSETNVDCGLVSVSVFR